MGREKLLRFEQNKSNNFIIEEEKFLFDKIKGKWNDLYFKNINPIVLEIGCGRGEYTIDLAKLNKHFNYVGIDLKGSRLWKGGKIADQEKLINVAFLRTRIENITDFFTENEVSELWITFPDPRPKDRDIKRRLTSLRFFDIYKKIIKNNALIHFKTDNYDLFQYTLNDVLPNLKMNNFIYTNDLYNSEHLNEITSIQTTYEKKYLSEGKKINYLKFNLINQ